MPAFKATLAYDGTDFVGWQRQASGVSVQGLLEDALRELDGDAVTVTAAGRTDAGAHALGQVVGFLLRRPIPADTVRRALNARLPDAVRVLDVAPVADSFHPRFDATKKTYRYRIWNGEVVSPFERRYVWHVVGALDVDAIAAAARELEGRHDFAAFQSVGSDVTSTERTLFTSAITRSAIADSLVLYHVTGDGFLRHMVRTIVGTLVEIGHRRQPPGWMTDVLASRDRARAGPTAPAQGLFLVAVDYGDSLATKS